MQDFLLSSILIFMGISAWSVATVGRKKELTISQHVAQSFETRLVFGVVASIATLLASDEIFYWLLPHYGAGFLSYIAFGLLMLGFLLAAIFPYIKATWRGTIHNIAAWGMCYIVPLVMIITLTYPLSGAARLIGTALLVISITLLILLATKKTLRRQFLAFQSGYLLVFFVFLIVVTYV